jgi:hypothetical protein
LTSSEFVSFCGRNLLHGVSWSLTRQGMYVQRNTVARSHNQCYSGRAMSVTYSECVLVALGIRLAMRMHHIVICVLCHNVPHFLVNGKIFGRNLIEHEMCFDFLSRPYLKHFSFVEYSKTLSLMYVGLHVKYS